MPYLRKVVVSPWSDLDAVSASLGNGCVLAWKPNPAQIAAAFDIDTSRQELEDVLRRTRRNVVEIVLKDVHTTGGDPARLDAYCRMAGELVGAG